MVGGQGGGGGQSFYSEPRKIFGGPDGGNGGDGGHVILKGKTQQICFTSCCLINLLLLLGLVFCFHKEEVIFL